MDSRKIVGKVTLGVEPELGDFVVIGNPPRNSRPDELETQIGDHAVIRSHVVIYAGNRIGNGFHAGHHVTIREFNTIGNDVSIGTGTVIEHHITIGDGVRIHSSAFIPEYSVLEDGCWIGPNAVLTNAKYPASPTAKANLKAPIIRRGAIVGANVTILPGVVIGAGALIGAGSVVTKDVPAGAVIAGNPAQWVRDVADLPQQPYSP